MNKLCIRKQAAKGNLIVDLAKGAWNKAKGAAGWVDDKAVNLGERLGTKKLAEILEGRAYKSAGKAADARDLYDFMTSESFKNKAFNQLRLADIMGSKTAKRAVGYGVGAAGTAGAGYGVYQGGKALANSLSKDSENNDTKHNPQTKDDDVNRVKAEPAEDVVDQLDGESKSGKSTASQALRAGGLVGSTALGAGLGALIDRRNRLRGMLIGGATAAGLSGLGLYMHDKYSKNS